MLGLERAEQGLFGTENLDSRAGRLGEVHERTSVGDETGAYELANKRSQIRCEGLHAVGEVVAQVLAVFGEVNNLLSQGAGCLEVFISNLGPHTDLCSGFDGSFDLLGQDGRQISVAGICAESHFEDNFGVGEVVVENLGKLGEVPAVPLLDAHGIGVELLVEDVEAGNALDDHGIDLVGGELELVAGKRVG